jgi:hypothetical protein
LFCVVLCFVFVLYPSSINEMICSSPACSRKKRKKRVETEPVVEQTLAVGAHLIESDFQNQDEAVVLQNTCLLCLKCTHYQCIYIYINFIIAELVQIPGSNRTMHLDIFSKIEQFNS